MQFIRSLDIRGRAFLLLALAGSLVAIPAAQAGIKNPGQYEIGLSMYSLRQLFKSGKLHAHDYPGFAKETFGITKIDVWDGGYPEGWQTDPDFLPELKRRADAVGSEIFLVMTGTVDAMPADDAALKKNGLNYKAAVDQAVTLGSTYVRVFLKVDKSLPDEESIRRAAVALGALADYAGPKGVTIVIEPSPNVPKGAYLAKLMTTMEHDHCKLMPDFGKMKKTDFYQGTKDMMPHTVVVSAKGHDFNDDGSQVDFDYPRLMRIVRDAGFTGIVAIEYEGKNRGPVEGVKAMQKILEENNSAGAGSDWHLLFDGSGLDGWKSNDENPDVFTVTGDGELKVSGGRAHLFWMGNDEIPGQFKNFEFTAKVKTTKGSNSGIFFHTRFQDNGWPEYGLEAQINTTHKDRRKTASIYAIQDVLDDAPSTDDQWFEYGIRVAGKQVTVMIDGKVVNDYTEPTPAVTPEKRPNACLGKGTLAIQGHDPNSTVYLKDIKVRLLD